jgi:aminoglycoside 6-adenylyltransferase
MYMDGEYQSLLLERITAWAKGQEGMRALALVGSGARQDHPADVWSDLDLLLVATDPQAWLACTGWLAEIGVPWFSFLERDPSGTAIERRVLFAGGQDVDFIILPVESARQGFAGTFIPEIARRGVRVLFDKDGILGPMAVETSPRPEGLPSFQEFSEVVNDFWFHAVWTAKKLRRGELWVAKSCCDDYLKRLLLRMLEWQAHAAGQGEVDTWFNGRFVEQWASPAALEKLRIAFAHYEEQDIWRALQASMELFDQLARETALRGQFEYPAENVGKVIGWISQLRIHSQDLSRGCILGS